MEISLALTEEITLDVHTLDFFCTSKWHILQMFVFVNSVSSYRIIYLANQ